MTVTRHKSPFGYSNQVFGSVLKLLVPAPLRTLGFSHRDSPIIFQINLEDYIYCCCHRRNFYLLVPFFVWDAKFLFVCIHFFEKVLWTKENAD